MIFYRNFIAVFLVTLFIGCKSHKTSDSDSLKEGFIEMSKTPCFGRCPVYQIKITSKGEATYLGRRNVDKIGAYHKTLDSKELTVLFNTFNNSGIWKMEDEYKANISDLPTTYVNFTYDGKTKNIKDHYNAPEELKNLEQMVEAIANNDGWVKDEIQPKEEY